MQVFKGTRGGEPVAVKVLEGMDTRALRDFKHEVVFLMNLHHSYVVQFLGACISVRPPFPLQLRLLRLCPHQACTCSTTLPPAEPAVHIVQHAALCNVQAGSTLQLRPSSGPGLGLPASSMPACWCT